jgi:hypothetical protein
VLEVFNGYEQVLIPVRIRSDHEKDDIRSLSTLARKRAASKNQRYSIGRESKFIEVMEMVLSYHPWLHRLGVDLGYRQDEYSWDFRVVSRVFVLRLFRLCPGLRKLGVFL